MQADLPSEGVIALESGYYYQMRRADTAEAEVTRLRAIVNRLPKDKDGKPMAVGMYALASGYEMGDWGEANATPYKIVSVCCDHVWLSQAPDDQLCFYANQCRVFDTLEAATAAVVSPAPDTE